MKFIECCLGLDSDLPDILESDLEGRADTNCFLEESWQNQGTNSRLLNQTCIFNVCLVHEVLHILWNNIFEIFFEVLIFINFVCTVAF
jgi:hypothetical protein